MCTACGLPKGTTLTEEEFENCWMSNQDGGGFCYLDEDGEIKVYKSLELDEFKNLWKEHHGKHGEYSPFLLHFRAKSAGEVSVDNCHPFVPNPKTAFIHNGTIYKVTADAKRSDTRIFSEDYLSQLPHNFLNNNFIIHMLDYYVGSTNKLAFLYAPTGKITITNEKDWTMHNGVAFSNTFFKIKRNRSEVNSNPTGVKMFYGGGWYDGVDWDSAYEGSASCNTPKSDAATEKKQESAKPVAQPRQIGYQSPVYKWCTVCLQSVSVSLWAHSAEMCTDCAAYSNELSRQLKIPWYSASNLLRMAAKKHTKEEFYAKMGKETSLIVAH